MLLHGTCQEQCFLLFSGAVQMRVTKLFKRQAPPSDYRVPIKNILSLQAVCQILGCYNVRGQAASAAYQSKLAHFSRCKCGWFHWNVLHNEFIAIKEKFGRKAQGDWQLYVQNVKSMGTFLKDKQINWINCKQPWCYNWIERKQKQNRLNSNFCEVPGHLPSREHKYH